jgi:uncharacterized protein with FMN-binding domain
MASATKYPLAILAGLSLVGALAGCAASTPTDTGSDAGSDSGTDNGTDTGTDTEAPAAGAYTDGTYTESGQYQAPSGTEEVEVTITLEGDIITAVQVVGGATDPQARQHQGEFIDGISAVVVGKDIDDIQVDKVGGSSLTSGGFNRAIDAIKADAAA